MFDAILWDVDGTLIDSEPLHERSFKAALKELGHTPPSDIHEATLGQSEQESFKWIQDTMGLTLSFHEWTMVRYKNYLSRMEETAPLEPCLGMWHGFADCGMPQGVVSNADRMIVGANIARIGIDQAHLISVTRNDVKLGKPDPEPYLRGAYLLDQAPERIAAVEDSATGARAALAAGHIVFMVPWADVALDGVRPLSELEDNLRALSQA